MCEREYFKLIKVRFENQVSEVRTKSEKLASEVSISVKSWQNIFFRKCLLAPQDVFFSLQSKYAQMRFFMLFRVSNKKKCLKYEKVKNKLLKFLFRSQKLQIYTFLKYVLTTYEVKKKSGYHHKLCKGEYSKVVGVRIKEKVFEIQKIGSFHRRVADIKFAESSARVKPLSNFHKKCSTSNFEIRFIFYVGNFIE